MQRRARIGREDVEGGGLDALRHRPADGAVEDIVVILVHAEDKTAVDHHAVVVQPANRRGVVAVQILHLVLRGQAGRIQRLEAHEEAAQSRGGGQFHQPGRSTLCTVPAACQTRPMPRIPAKSAAAKRGSPKRWSSRK